MNKRNIFLWTLYDFANSIVLIVFFLYFSQWLVVDNKVQDIWFNLIFIGSTFLLLFTSPIFGSIADKTGNKMPFLRIATILAFFGFLGTSLFANFGPTSQAFIIFASASFLLANYFYQFSFTFYNALLNDIAPPRVRGFVSGIGQSANWLGQIVGLLITLPLVTGSVFLIGRVGRSQAFLPATLIFFLLSLPMLLFFREQARTKKITTSLAREYKYYIRSFTKLWKTKGMRSFLLGYFFFNDAMLTAVNNLPIYLEQVFRVPDKTKSILLASSLLMSAVGALATGFVSDKVGLKKSLLVILVLWVIIFPLMAITTKFFLFSIALIAVGFLFGATWTVTRAVMSYLSPQNRLTHAFSYYTLAERFATFVGPVTWGLVTLLLKDTGDFRYRVALILMAIFILLGLLIVKNIPSENPKTS